MYAAIKEKKFERTTKAQLECYVAFLKEHPEMLSGKNTPVHPRQMEELWEQVTRRLNSLEGATRTPNKWKESLANWKKQFRCRARKAKAERALTGGGPAPSDVDDFELRALETFGVAAVDGIPAEALGFQVIDCDVECETVILESPHQPIFGSPARRRILTSTPNTSSSLCSPPRTSRYASRRDENSPPKKLRKVGSQQIVGAVLEHMKKREEQDKKTAEVLTNLTQALLGITEVLKNLANK